MNPFDQLSESEKIERYERLARKALTAYGLEEAELHFLGQSSNIIFRVRTDDGRWMLRICTPGRDRDRLMRELLWLVALCRDTDVVVPEPVIMRSGDLLHSVSMPGLSGFHACMLFRWVKGRFEDDLTVDQLRAVGRLTAVLHNHAETFRWPEELTPAIVTAETIEAMVAWPALKPHCSVDDVQVLQATIPIIQRAVGSLGHGHDISGVIHGDLHQGNYLFHGEEARAIGFDHVQWNYYVYDIAATFSCLRGGTEVDSLKSAYVEGYTNIRPLPGDLNEHIPAFTMLRTLTIVSQMVGTGRSQANERTLEVVESAVATANRLLKQRSQEGSDLRS